MIHSITNGKKHLGVLMYRLAMLSLLIGTPIFSQVTNSDQKELDQILRKELGVTESNQNNGSNSNSNGNSKLKSENNSNNEKNENESNADQNPIKERYAENSDDSPSATWILLKILFVLSILVVAGYYLVQKMQVSKAAKYPVKGFMKVLSTMSLAPGQSLQIVEVGGRLLVLGVAEGSINLVTEITSAEEKSNIDKMKLEADPYVPNFLETLLESLQTKAQTKIRINKKIAESSDSEINTELHKKTRDSLDRLRKHRELLEGGQ